MWTAPPRHRFADVRGFRLHIGEQGQGRWGRPGTGSSLPTSAATPGVTRSPGVADGGRHSGLRGGLRPARRAGVHRGLRLIPEHRTQQRTARALPGSRDRRSCAECGGRGDHDMVTALHPRERGGSLSEILRGQGGSGNPATAAVPQLHVPVVLLGCALGTAGGSRRGRSRTPRLPSPASTTPRPDDATRHPPRGFLNN